MRSVVANKWYSPCYGKHPPSLPPSTKKEEPVICLCGLRFFLKTTVQTAFKNYASEIVLKMHFSKLQLQEIAKQ